MNTANTNRELFVCYYGTSNNSDFLRHMERIWPYTFNITHSQFYSDTTTDDKFFNLWRCSVTKRNIELNRKKNFDCVLAINTDDEILTRTLLDRKLFHLLLRPNELFNLKEKRLYFCQGEFVNLSNTAIDPSIFYANSEIFDLAANFGLVHKIIEQKRNTVPLIGKMLDIKKSLFNTQVNFYYYLKSLKIDTECVNYENRGMFKRAT